MSTVIQQLSLTDLSELYQVAYGGFEVDAAGWDNRQLLGSIRKNEKFNGNKLEIGQLLDYGGGQSSGGLPSSSTAYMVRPTLFAKSVYSTTVLDNQSMKAARRAGTNLGAFEDATELSMNILKQSFQEQIARQFFGDGTGELGEIASVVTNAPGDYSVTITAASFIQAHWIRNDLLNVASSTDLFLVSDINLSTRVIRILRQNGSHVPLAGEKIYKQKSKDNEMLGLGGVCDAVSGDSLYGVTVDDYRWKPTKIDAAGSGPSVKLFRQLDQEMRFTSRGVLPTDYIFSHTQLRLFEDSEDSKSIIYVEPSVAPEREAGSQVAAVKLNGRTVRIQWSPYCPEDRVYAINRNKISLELRPDTIDKGEDCGGFIENGDSIFFPLHVSGTPLDSFAMFYATYGNFFINPTFTGCIDGLATS
jgi:hypothetical protein